MLSKKILRLFFGISLFASIIGGIVLYQINQSHLERTARDTQLLITSQTLDTIDRLFYERLGDIQVISQTAEVVALLSSPDILIKEKVSKKHFDYLNIYGSLRSISVLDDQGTVLDSTDDELEGLTLTPASEEEFKLFKQALDGSVVFSDFFISPLTGKTVVAFAAPVRSPEGKILGASIAHVDWLFIEEILQSNGFEHHLFSRTGKLISGSHHVSYDQNSLLKTILAGASGSDIFTLEDEKILGTYSQENGYLDYTGNKWTLLLEQPTREILSGINRAAFVGGSLLIVILLLCAAFAYIMFHQIVMHPIEELTSITKKMSGGDLSQKIKIDSNDELGVLGKTFNDMAENLERTYAELEHKVTERTNTLEEKIEQLDALNKHLIGREIKMNELKEKIRELEKHNVHSQ